MARLEVFMARHCREGALLADWLAAQKVAHLLHDLGDPAVAERLRARTRIGISPVSIVEGRVIWGDAAEHIRRIRRLLR